MVKLLKALCEEFKAQIRSELRKFWATVVGRLKRELRKIKNSLTFISQMYGETKSDLADFKSYSKELKFENANLHITCNQLTNLVKSTAGRLLQCEEYSRKANIEINGVPKEGEKNQHTSTYLGNFVRHQINQSQLLT